MAISFKIAARSGKGLAGDAHELAERLGTPGELAELSFTLMTPASHAVVDLPSLRRFLTRYVSSVLIPVELPLVRQGFERASRGAIRELIVLDQSHVPTGLAKGLAQTSKIVGRAQLGRMRPLRGERRVQGYWRAVQQGEAQAWHAIVYGLILAVYGLPLRQGLLHFGRQTVRGFLDSAQDRLALDEADCLDLESGMEAKWAPAMGELISGSAGQRLPIV